MKQCAWSQKQLNTFANSAKHESEENEIFI